MKVGEVVFSGITEEGPALYQVGKASFNNVTLDVSDTGSTFTMSVPQAGAEGWYIRASAPTHAAGTVPRLHRPSPSR